MKLPEFRRPPDRNASGRRIGSRLADSPCGERHLSGPGSSWGCGSSPVSLLLSGAAAVAVGDPAGAEEAQPPCSVPLRQASEDTLSSGSIGGNRDCDGGANFPWGGVHETSASMARRKQRQAARPARSTADWMRTKVRRDEEVLRLMTEIGRQTEADKTASLADRWLRADLVSFFEKPT